MFEAGIAYFVIFLLDRSVAFFISVLEMSHIINFYSVNLQIDVVPEIEVEQL